MNKYFILLIIIAAIILAGVGYRTFLLPEESVPVSTGIVREITVTARKDHWSFTPEVIVVDRGDRVMMTVINEDSYDHGIGLDAFGISQRMPARSTIVIEFTATQGGEYPFYCSVPCGDGVVDGERRSHFDMIGKLHVRSIVSETQ